jgi:glycosyltransferase involved in cell wall biosynthesis
MACEVPVVASRVGGLPEVIDDGVTGFLRAPDDLDGMTECALKVLTDRGLRDRMAAAARHAAVSRFAAERVVPLYERAYELLVNK